jgi:hypothetical protein
MPAVLKRASRRGGQVARNPAHGFRLEIAGMTTTKPVRHAKTFRDGGAGFDPRGEGTFHNI